MARREFTAPEMSTQKSLAFLGRLMAVGERAENDAEVPTPRQMSELGNVRFDCGSIDAALRAA